jgi:hypothetical protein
VTIGGWPEHLQSELGAHVGLVEEVTRLGLNASVDTHPASR